MKVARLLVVAGFAILATGVSAGEDRVERFPDPHGAGAKELVYRNDKLAEERAYDAEGALLEENFYDSAPLPIQTRKYIREGGRLSRVEYDDADGVPTGSQTYRYDRYSRLIGVDTDGDLGASSVGMISVGAIPQASWVSGDSTLVLGYDDAGRAVIVQVMKDGAAVSTERKSYTASGLLSSVHIEDMASGLVTELTYDDGGRISRKTEIPQKGPQTRTDYRYDESSRLVEETQRRGGHRTARSLAYSESGTIKREETRRDGELVLAVENIDNGRVEELFDKGELFVKATYIGGRKIKDEFFVNGASFRTREY